MRDWKTILSDNRLNKAFGRSGIKTSELNKRLFGCSKSELANSEGMKRAKKLVAALSNGSITAKELSRMLFSMPKAPTVTYHHLNKPKS